MLRKTEDRSKMAKSLDTLCKMEISIINPRIILKFQYI